MTKRQINKRQRFRIKKLQDQKLVRAQKKLTTLSTEMLDEQLGPEQQGLLIAHYGAYIDVEAESGKIYRCNLRQNITPLVAGDHVVFRAGKGSVGVVEALCPRQSLLAKPEERNKIRPIAANIDQIFIVIAPEPWPVQSLIDSYFIAADAVGIKSILLLNKIDLLEHESKKSLQQMLTLYGNIGYPIATTTAMKSSGLSSLKDLLHDKTSIFVGQSGVGKSSLINALIPDAKLATGDLSKLSRHGVHTTTTSQLFHLPFGGDIIDSPGIREFGLWHMQAEDIARGFLEFRDYLGHCKFRNCQHKKEPGCAVLEAVNKGLIAPSRLQSYYDLLESLSRVD